MKKRFSVPTGLLLGCLLCLAPPIPHGAAQPAQAASSGKPNIVFVILDDVGIDQLGLFGNGGVDPPKTPNLDLIAKAGVKFTNVWATPECSPSRATLLTGRFALRTGVEDIIADNHLPQSYMSSFEATLPRVLQKAGYTSAMMGKYHLGNTQDPAGECAPLTRGFAVFRGDLAGEPKSIDETAGGIDPTGKQSCGYFQTKSPGACYTTQDSKLRCSPINSGNADPSTDPARTCLQHGGIFVPNKACGTGAPTLSDFNLYNAYYVSQRWSLSGVRNPLYVNPGSACPSTIDRRYLTEIQASDGEAWWKRQTGPRMLTLSFSSMHTPYQKASTRLVPDPKDPAATCSSSVPQRDTLNSMLEGVDVQFGRTLAGLGLATIGPDTRTLTSLDLGSTLLVVIGDNGTQGTATRAPFNPARAKSTVYQTGIWVPLIIAGPMVRKPNRSVDDMINTVDLYRLFGDIAGVDVTSVVPPSHVLDSRPMLPYLTNPSTSELRKTNFTQSGVATFSPDPSQRSWPCQIGSICDDTLFGPGKQTLCEVDNGGTWYGPGGKKQLSSCCAVQTYLNQTQDNPPTLSLAPIHQR
ncbi:MAG TPA: sulfatase-like hydrolase/transferase, partial [Alphaproteobacteria bacterium]|nr:sulfatase-like hydrolase/transferase [Alphaproteobacteria bacterium]